LNAQHTMLAVWAGGRPNLSLGHFAWLTPWSLRVKCVVRPGFRRRPIRPQTRICTSCGDRGSWRDESQFLELFGSIVASVPADYTRNR
jgi:hypothetical protein